MASIVTDVGASIRSKTPPPPPAKPKPPAAPKPAPPKPAAKPATVPYNPYGYVPGGSSTKVAATIEAQAIETPGPKPVAVPAAIERSIPASTEVTTSTGAVVTFGGGPDTKQQQVAPPPFAGGGGDAADQFLADAVPLTGAGAFQQIEASCDLYGIEDKAACADGLHEGFGGGIGDGGTAYGPWQEHLTDGRIPAIAGLPHDDERVQRWAWSAAGIAHGIRAMSDDSPSARGLTGHPAVHAIVYGFERPRDEAGAYTTRAAEYDHLVSLGAGWKAYVIARLHGPGLPGTTPEPLQPPFGATATTPTGAKTAWTALMHTLGTTLPGLGATAQRVGSTLPGV